jgi:hypothetical protein
VLRKNNSQVQKSNKRFECYDLGAKTYCSGDSFLLCCLMQVFPKKTIRLFAAINKGVAIFQNIGSQWQ